MSFEGEQQIVNVIIWSIKASEQRVHLNAKSVKICKTNKSLNHNWEYFSWQFN